MSNWFVNLMLYLIFMVLTIGFWRELQAEHQHLPGIIGLVGTIAWLIYCARDSR